MSLHTKVVALILVTTSVGLDKKEVRLAWQKDHFTYQIYCLVTNECDIHIFAHIDFSLSLFCFFLTLCYSSWFFSLGTLDDWLKFDDDVVTSVKSDDIKALSGGGDWHMAYVLL